MRNPSAGPRARNVASGAPSSAILPRRGVLLLDTSHYRQATATLGSFDRVRESIMTDTSSTRLTQFAKRAGCAAKQPPDYLLALLAGLPPIVDPNVLVGHSTSDDAAVYRLSDELALILTTDFFTPVVDRPYDFGAVAAANALSDVYAMGGTPMAALSLVGFPSGTLPPEVLAEILRGAIDKAAEAGIAIVGGHTIQTDEPIFGLAVVGRARPEAVITNSGAHPGDFLVLTKPLGLGIITTAAKRNEDDQDAISQAITVMTMLNRDASAIMVEAGAHALTDVTGFGLLGHLRGMVAASRVSGQVWTDLVPSLPAAKVYVQRGIAPGGSHANLRFLSNWVDYDADVTDHERLLLCDAQTSGGLLAALPGDRVAQVVRKLQAVGATSTALIGSIEAGSPGRIHVRRAPQSGAPADQ
jgi:selenide,water dikinase